MPRGTSKKWKVEFSGAVTHIDNTGRVQDVSKKLNFYTMN